VWEHYRPFFEQRGYRCVTPTLRHHGVGATTPPDPRLGRASLLDYVADLSAEIAALEAPPILMGHSMGALLAQSLATRVPAKALVLLTPAQPAGVVWVLPPSVIRAFLSGFLHWGFWRKPLRQTFGEASYAMMHCLPESDRRPLYDRLCYESGRAACEIGYWYLDPRHAARVEPNRVTLPTLVVGAAEDRITPVSIVRRVARRYPQATYREFPGHAHWVLGEPGWEQIAAFCAGWLAGQVGSPA
jgi:pimeloyl-ACP methyl ester carboxylesterase